MSTLIWIAVVAVSASEFTPKGELEPVRGWGKDTGWVLPAGSTTAFEATGPASFVLEIRGPAELKGTPVKVEILRDGQFVSKNTVSLKKKGKKPQGYPMVVKLAIKVPAGEHTYELTSDSKVALLATPTKKFQRKLAAAEEEQIAAEPEAVEASADTGDGDVADATGDALAEAPADPATDESPSETIAAAPAETVAVGATTNLVQATRIAVYDFELDGGITSNIGTVVTDSMLAEVRKLKGVSAIGMDEIRDMLSHEANKQVMGCESNESCLAEIAGALGVDDLITGKLSKAGDSHVMVVRRIDQKRAKVAGSVNKRLKAGSGQEFLLAIGPSVEELFPDRELREGMKRGVPDEVALRLDPPPLPTWAFWGVAGGAGVAAAAGGVFGLLAQSAQKDYDDYAKLGQNQVIEGRTLKSKGNTTEDRALLANAAFITAGALAVTAAVMYLFTDWEGYGEAEAK